MNEIKFSLTLPQSLFTPTYLRILESLVTQKPVNKTLILSLIENNWILLGTALRNQTERIIEDEIMREMSGWYKGYIHNLKEILDWVRENRNQSATATPLNKVLSLPVVNLEKERGKNENIF